MFEEKVAKKNFILSILRQASWGFGSGFVVESTIVIIFLTHFTDSKVVISLLATIPAIAGAIMPLVSDFFTKHIQRKKALLSFLIFLNQLCWLGITVFAFFANSFKHSTVLIAFFVLYALAGIIMGIINPVNYTFIAKIIPKNRGAFFGFGDTSAGFLAIMGAIFAKMLLENFVFPFNYAYCFLFAFIIRTAHIGLIMACEEKDNMITPAENKFHLYIKELIDLLKKEKRFRNFIFVQMLVSLSGMGSMFYSLYIKSIIDLTPTVLGTLTIFAVAGQTIAGIFSGLFGDAKGHKVTYATSLIIGIVVVGFALFGRTAEQFYLMFFLEGVGGIIGAVAGSTLIMEMAPAELSGRYFAVNTAVLAPFAALAPLVGGVLIDRTSSYIFVFSITMVFVLAALILFLGQKNYGYSKK